MHKGSTGKPISLSLSSSDRNKTPTPPPCLWDSNKQGQGRSEIESQLQGLLREWVFFITFIELGLFYALPNSVTNGKNFSLFFSNPAMRGPKEVSIVANGNKSFERGKHFTKVNQTHFASLHLQFPLLLGMFSTLR